MVSKKNRHQTSSVSPYNNYVVVLVICILTFLVFLPAWQSDFVNWDDESYIHENPLVQNLSVENVVKMFHFDRFLIGNYHPLTEFSFAINHAMGGLNPKVYIGTNIFLHLLNTILVFFFFYRFSDKNQFIAGVVSILFAIHPMHIESVSWISERKDVLYVCFFMAGLLSYLTYKIQNKQTYFWWTMVFFIASLLSKAQAVTFPIVLVLIDIFWDKKWEIKTILNKIPFFVLSLLAGLWAIHAQDNALRMVELDMGERVLVGSYAWMTYLWKSILPINLCAFHSYPENQDWSIWYYIAPLLLVAFLAFLTWTFFAKKKHLFFGGSFFLLTVFPVLQFMPVGMTVFAERYTYLPYLGLFYLMAYYFHKLYASKKESSHKKIFITILGIIMFGFGVISHQRTKVWKTSETLWADVIQKYPKNFIAYVNASDYCRVQGKLDKAVAYAEQGLKQSGPHSYLYNNKAYALMMGKKYQAALKVLDEGMQKVNPDEQMYVNQGDSYLGLKKYDQAIQSFTKVLELNPQNFNSLLKRAATFLNHQKNWTASIQDYQQILATYPQNVESLSNIALAYYEKGDIKEGLNHINLAIDIQKNNKDFHYLRYLIYQSLEQIENMEKEKTVLLRLGVQIPQ